MTNYFELFDKRLQAIETRQDEILARFAATNPAPFTDEDKLLNVRQAAEFMDISEQTVYQNIKKIPHKKRFGRLYFLKSELVAYLQAGTQRKA